MASRKLTDADPRLADAFCKGRAAYQQDYPGKVISITCTHRSTEEQQELYAHGRSKPGQIVTQIDGVTKKSNHNFYPSRAIDFCIEVGGKVVWAEAEYKVAGPYFAAQGLQWGGNWKTFKDLPHVELPEEA